MPPRWNKARQRWEIDEHVTLPSGKKKRLRRKSPINSKASAREYGQQAVRALLDSSTSGSTGPAPRFDAFVRKDYLRKYAAGSNRQSTAEVAESICRVHLLPAFGRLRLDQIGAEQIEAYKARKLQTHGPRSVLLHLTFLKRILSLAVEWERLGAVPTIRMPKLPPVDHDHLTPREVEQLLASAEPVWRPVFTVLAHTGMRIGEACALQWASVGPERLVVRVTLVKDRLHPPKGGKERTIPLNSEARAALAELPRVGPWVFPAKGRVRGAKGPGPVQRYAVDRALARACKAAGLREVSPHVLRHTFASQLVAGGVPLRAVQELLGHSTIAQTERYAHLAAGAVEAAVKVLEPKRQATRGATGKKASRKTGAPAERGSRRKGKR